MTTANLDRAHVRALLDDAQAQGAWDLDTARVEEVSADLVAASDDLGEGDEVTLSPVVREWLRDRRAAALA